MSTRTAKPRAVRCVCKNRDRHFGVCKCHRHKGDTASDISLRESLQMTDEQIDALASMGPEVADGTLTGEEAEAIVRNVRTDVWWCAKCNREWTVPSLPHNPACPTCGAGGWWRRFA